MIISRLRFRSNSCDSEIRHRSWTTFELSVLGCSDVPVEFARTLLRAFTSKRLAPEATSPSCRFAAQDSLVLDYFGETAVSSIRWPKTVNLVESKYHEFFSKIAPMQILKETFRMPIKSHLQ